MALKILICWNCASFWSCYYCSFRSQIIPLLALTTPCPDILHFPANIFPNKLAANVLNKILRNPHFYFTSFSITLLMLLFQLIRFLRWLNYFHDIFIYLFEIINAVMPDPKIFLLLMLLPLILMVPKRFLLMA